MDFLCTTIPRVRMEIFKQLYHSDSLNSININSASFLPTCPLNWLLQHEGWLARHVANQRQNSIGPVVVWRYTNRGRQHRGSYLGCVSAVGFHVPIRMFWYSPAKPKHNAAKSAVGRRMAMALCRRR